MGALSQARRYFSESRSGCVILKCTVTVHHGSPPKQCPARAGPGPGRGGPLAVARMEHFLKHAAAPAFRVTEVHCWPPPWPAPLSSLAPGRPEAATHHYWPRMRRPQARRSPAPAAGSLSDRPSHKPAQAQARKPIWRSGGRARRGCVMPGRCPLFCAGSPGGPAVAHRATPARRRRPGHRPSQSPGSVLAALTRSTPRLRVAGPAEATNERACSTPATREGETEGT